MVKTKCRKQVEEAAATIEFVKRSLVIEWCSERSIVFVIKTYFIPYCIMQRSIELAAKISETNKISPFIP